MNHIFSSSKWAQHMKNLFIVCFCSVDSALLSWMKRLTASPGNDILHICVIRLADLHKQLITAVFSLESPDAHLIHECIACWGDKTESDPWHEFNSCNQINKLSLCNSVEETEKNQFNHSWVSFNYHWPPWFLFITCCPIKFWASRWS